MLIIDYNCFFVYKGKAYGAGTGIKLKQEYINTYLYNGYRIWQYAYLSNINYKENKYMFNKYKTYPYSESQGCVSYFSISQSELDNVIEEIIEPKPVNVSRAKPKNDGEVEGMGILWTIYIAVMVASLIFREFYIIWIAASVFFFKLRKEILNK